MRSLFFFVVGLTTIVNLSSIVLVVEGVKEDENDGRGFSIGKSETSSSSLNGGENEMALALLAAAASESGEEQSPFCKACLYESANPAKRQFNAWGGKRGMGLYGKLSPNVYRQILESFPIRIIRGSGTFNPWGGKRSFRSSNFPETNDVRVPKNEASKPRFSPWGGK